MLWVAIQKVTLFHHSDWKIVEKDLKTLITQKHTFKRKFCNMECKNILRFYRAISSGLLSPTSLLPRWTNNISGSHCRISSTSDSTKFLRYLRILAPGTHWTSSIRLASILKFESPVLKDYNYMRDYAYPKHTNITK